MNQHKSTFRLIATRPWLQLWRDERGVASAYALILVAVILILGAVVGLTNLRDHIVQEFGDLGVAIDSLDQSFGYQITVTPQMGPPQVVVSALYIDQDELGWSDPNGQAPAGLSFAPGFPGSQGEDGPIP
ncbi:hypothetical protein LOC68_22975 [Blastopirellula sp. JC732]|uniref:Uncharacterized protein n=1 Tax=Blastopirellula sediminis TaxID=2894196 RepID=A0A9X1MSH3_9BACT|nr:hypothetical protein [Blastopirellula sediminis]MCC9605433.1 hypothetical protein [Blastopirellula sediminis]MCC9631267.1 hypothetical protein [Blastopirellula sediminis]